MTHPASLPDVMCADQVAQLCDCEPSTIEEATRERRFPGVKLGRSWVYPREAVLAALNSQALANVAPAAPAPGPANAVKPLKLVPVAKKAPRRRSPAPLPDPPGFVGGTR